MRKEEGDPMQKNDLLKAKAFAVVAATGVFGYKIIVTPFILTVDFPTLLSLLLAIFSVFLSALFYFKATETSNTFYDNTYKFTQDIASLLVKIESGFGEKLRHLDEGYTSMRDRMDKLPGKYEIEETKTEIKKEEEDFKKKLADKDRLIDELAHKAHLKDNEREQFKDELNKRIAELSEAQSEISFLRERMERTERRQPIPHNIDIDDGMKHFILSAVFKELSPKLFLSAPTSLILKRFNASIDSFPDGFIEDLRRYEMINDNKEITRKGISIFRRLAERSGAATEVMS